ncbi:hypothetical protein [Hymenobacter terrenus]|uniref:hypothetical protein n=1 Tax=Hymenobacter terrenus TaxID=1629124 RepID=UPI000619D105|nr:hypothetical protein [Hymenobacter terrenus]
MDWQATLNLFLPLATTVAVLFITNRHNVRLKRLDVEQRKADHEQEFRKLYAAKRIDSAEQYVGRLVSIIDKLDLLRAGLLTADFGEEADNAYSAKLLKRSEDLQAAADAISSKSLNTAYLYFEEEVLEQKTGDVAGRLIVAEKHFVDVATDKKMIWRLFNEADIKSQSKQNLGHSYHEKEAELTHALENYIASILEYREYLVGVCGAIRADLSKYGLAKTV